MNRTIFVLAFLLLSILEDNMLNFVAKVFRSWVCKKCSERNL